MSNHTTANSRFQTRNLRNVPAPDLITELDHYAQLYHSIPDIADDDNAGWLAELWQSERDVRQAELDRRQRTNGAFQYDSSYRRDDIDTLKSLIDVIQLIGEYTELTQNGRSFRGRCPLHEGDNPSSLSVGFASGAWYCHACNAGGDVIKWLQVADGLTFVEALNVLASRAGIELERNPEYADAEARAEAMQTESILLSESATDEGNAQCVNALYGDKFLHCDALGWLYWAGTHWTNTEASKRLDRAIVDTLTQRRQAAVGNEKHDAIVTASKQSSAKVKACEYLFRSIVSVDVSRFDADPDLLNCRNGVIDLRTGELAPHSPDQFFTYCINVDYDQKVDYSEWAGLVRDWVATDDMGGYVQRAIGYSMTGHTREEVVFYVFGPTRSGKGTLTEVTLVLLGNPLSKETDFDTFTAKRMPSDQNFDLAPLKPARFVTASESNKNQTLNPAKIKRLTGGNEIYCAHKHKDFFSYRPQYKIWLTSNHGVKADVEDDAVWVRVKVIEFPNSFAGREDNGLKEYWKKPEKLQQVLAWAVDGAKEWYVDGLQEPNEVTQSTTAARAELDYVQKFLDDWCTVDIGKDDMVEPHKDLYAAFKDWCEGHGVKPDNGGEFTRRLTRKGLKTGRPYLEIDGTSKQVRAIFGVRLTVDFVEKEI